MTTESEKFSEACAETGVALAVATLEMWFKFNGGRIPAPVFYNAMGNIIVEIFGVLEFESPDDRLIEFDSWVKYTREQIVESNKASMQ